MCIPVRGNYIRGCSVDPPHLLQSSAEKQPWGGQHRSRAIQLYEDLNALCFENWRNACPKTLQTLSLFIHGPL